MDIVINCELYYVHIGVIPTRFLNHDYRNEYGIFRCCQIEYHHADKLVKVEEGDSLVAIVNMSQVGLAMYSALRRCILDSTLFIEES